MKKINWKKIVREIPETEQLKLLEEKRKKWKYPQSRDGFIETWREIFTYKGIKFQLAILRYFALDDGFIPLSSRVSDKHVVVEYPKSTEPLVNFVKSLGYSDFLWHDTLNSGKYQTLEEQLEEANKMAKKDIDNLPKLFSKKEKELKIKLKKLKEFKKKFLKKSTKNIKKRKNET